MPPFRPEIERFNEKWEPDADGCHIWTRATDRYGYGKFGPYQQQTMKAHVWIFIYTHGFQPPAILHHCDKRACVRLSCLMPGDHASNMADMIAKGRSLAGEAHPAAKLDWSKVEEIRLRYKRGSISQQVLANEYEVSLMTVNDIVNYRKWTRKAVA